MNKTYIPKIKIVFDTPEFLVTGNTIKCRINFHTEGISEKIDKIARTAFGETTCKNNDKFNFEVGSKIALAKAERDAYDFTIKRCKYALKKHKESVNLFENTISDLERYIKHETDFIIKSSNTSDNTMSSAKD